MYPFCIFCLFFISHAFILSFILPIISFLPSDFLYGVLASWLWDITLLFIAPILSLCREIGLGLSLIFIKASSALWISFWLSFPASFASDFAIDSFIFSILP